MRHPVVRLITGVFLSAVSARALAQEPVPRRELSLDFRIVPSAELRLTHVSDLEVSAQGQLFVAQPEQRLVRVFDNRGQPRSVLARRRDRRSLAFPIRAGWKHDSLWVWDIQESHITLFDAIGEPVRDIAIGTMGSARLLQDGTIAIKRYDEDAVRRKSGGLSAPILRYDSEGVILDTIADIDAKFDAPMRIPVGVSSVQAPQPFADGPLWSITPRGSAIVLVDRTTATKAGPAHFHVVRLTMTGDTVFAKRYPYAAQPLSRALVQARIEDLVESLTPLVDHSGARARVDRDAIAKSMTLPETVPPITALVVGNDESIWLRGPDSPAARTVNWRVLDANGRPIASVVAPKELQILRARTDRVWGTEKRKADSVTVVSYVVR